MHGDHGVELLLGHLLQRGIARDACIVDHDIDGAEGLDRSLEESLDLVQLGHVAARSRRSISPTKRSDRTIHGLGIKIAKNDTSAFSEHRLSDGESQSLRASSDDGRTTFEQRHANAKFSMIVALDMPPASHIVWRPYRTLLSRM